MILNKHFNPLFLYEAPEDLGGSGFDDDTSSTENLENEGGWTGPTQEEWEQTREAIQQVTGIVPTVQQMSQVFQQLQQGQQGDDDEGDLDIGEYVERIIEGRLAPIMPIVQSSAQRSGQERMKELLSEHEKTLGKFDHELAERVAHSYFAETGDPVKAVEAGAKLAAEIRKRERDEGVNEYKASLKRPVHGDPGVDGSGERAPLKAKTYDEVIEAYAGQTEV